jgi:signal transduction histidine kinase/ligand-binding sensor domain-containing protein
MVRRMVKQALVVTGVCAGLAALARDGNGANGFTPTNSNPAKTEDTTQTQYRITRWTAENGLPQNHITALAQTPDGYLWLGTLAGLARFDGLRFKAFNHRNTPEMTHDAINDLAVDQKDGSLWIATEAGLFCYHDHQFQRYGAEEGLTQSIGRLGPVRDGGVWFSARPGQVSLARAGKLHTLSLGTNLLQHTVAQFGELNPAKLLLLLKNPVGVSTLQRLDLNERSLSIVSVPGKAIELSGVCSSFTLDGEGSLWLCTGQGIWRGPEKAWTQITVADAKSRHWPERVYPTHGGQTWVIQFEGNRMELQRLSAGRLVRFTAPELSDSLNVNCLLQDREDNLWVGSTTGLLRLQQKRIKVYSRRDGLRNDNILAVTRGADDTIWLGTDKGLSAIRDGKIENLPPPPGDEFWEATPVFLVDKENAPWVQSQNHSLARFQQGTWQAVPVSAEITQSKYLKALHQDRQGRIWLASDLRLFCATNQHWNRVTGTNGLSPGETRVVYQDRGGTLWFGTYGGGLNLLKEGEFTAFKTSYGFYNNCAWWIHEDAEGLFWVATEDGLNRFVPPGVEAPIAGKQRFFTFTTQHGLGENVVNNIQEDEFGCLWLSGLRGIYRVSRRELNEVAAGLRPQVRCVAYGEADGMLNSECNGGDNQPAGCKDKDGHLWFPTTQGAVVIDPKIVPSEELPPLVEIEQVLANDRVVFGDDLGSQSLEVNVQNPQTPPPQTPLRLAPGHARVLEIHYTGNSLVAPERMRFKYRLEGHDENWRWDEQNRRVAFYTNLRPGRYTFRVTACNSYGLWNQQGAHLAFTVAPHYWETWLFYLGAGSAMVIAGTGLHYQRVRRLRHLQTLEQQRALEQERSRIARDLHDDLGANLTGLALQLDLAQNQRAAPELLQPQLANLSRSTRGLVDNMREVVWAMNPLNDNLESLANFLGQYAEQYLAAAGLRCRLELPLAAQANPVSSPIRHQLFLVVKEALHNAVRHAQATEVELRLEQLQRNLRLTIEDDGCGLPPEATRIPNHGLDNMRKRVQDVGGSFSASTRTSGGTRLEICIPLDAVFPRN